jgi:hypothetical protein
MGVVTPTTRKKSVLSLSVNDISEEEMRCQCPVTSGSVRVEPVVESKEGHSVEQHRGRGAQWTSQWSKSMVAGG